MRCLGLVDAQPIEGGRPAGAPQRTYTLDQFDVVEYSAVSMLTCSCARSDALVLSNSDLRKVSPVTGLCACETCLDEIDACIFPRDRVAAFIKQNLSRINPEDHLRLPSRMAQLTADGKPKRPRRFVYECFHNVSLPTKMKVLHTCNDPECVNPYHMICSPSCAVKLTPEIKKDLKKWLATSLTQLQIQEQVSRKYKISISLSTIKNFKKSLLRSQSTQSCLPC